MAESLVYGVWCWKGGRLVQAVEGLLDEKAAVGLVREVLATLEVAGGAWLKLAPGVRCLMGTEHGGWCVVLWRAWRGDPLVKARKTRPAPAPVKGGRAVPQPPPSSPVH